jgi:hypothetical protein
MVPQVRVRFLDATLGSGMAEATGIRVSPSARFKSPDFLSNGNPPRDRRDVLISYA